MTTASLLRYQKKGAAQYAHSTLPKSSLDLAAEVELRDLLPRVFNFPQEAREVLRRHGLQRGLRPYAPPGPFLALPILATLLPVLVTFALVPVLALISLRGE